MVGSKQTAVGSRRKIVGGWQTAVGSWQRVVGSESAHCPLPTTPRPLPTSPRSLPSAYRLLPTAPSGISLIEVLFAMGIMAVGILSLVMLVPLGAYEMSEAAKMDQSSTLGRASFRDLEVRGYLQPKLWVDTQLGFLIGPDPADTSTYGKRLITYPYLPLPYPASPLKPAAPPSNDIFMPHDPQQRPSNSQFQTNAPLGTLLSNSFYTSAPAFPPPFAAAEPVVVIDPLFVARNVASAVSGSALPIIQTFPNEWTLITSAQDAQTRSVPIGAPLIPRLTVAAWPLPPFPSGTALANGIWPAWTWGNWNQARIMPNVLADRIFRSSDDLLFNSPNRDHDRPYAILDQGVPQYQGSYTWFVTVAPDAGELDSKVGDIGDPASNPDISAAVSAKKFSASVVVCQNRVFDLSQPSADVRPPEWMVQAVVNNGIGGGDVSLAAIDANTSGSYSVPATYQTSWLASLHPGQWLMLSGIIATNEARWTDTSKNNFEGWWKYKTVANWYRIVAVDDGAGLSPPANPPPPIRNVTLHGPDWPQNVQYTFATIVEGVVGVFQKTITLDGDSPFKLP